MRARVLMAFMTGTGFVACGDGGGGGGGGSGSFASEYATLMCDRLADCCADTGTPIEAGTCRAQMERKASERPEGLELDQAAADACLAKARATEGCGSEIPECENVFRGKKQPGEACEDSQECAAPAGGLAECGIGFGDEADRCVHLLRGKAGDTCAETCTETSGDGFSSELCAGASADGEHVVVRCYTNDGLFCADATSKCETLRAAGESCAAGERCGSGLFCPIGAVGGDRTCTAWLAEGADCRDESGDACGEGYCAEADGKCHAPKAAGETCDPDAFEAGCGRNGYCDDDGKCAAEGFGDGLELVCGLVGGAFGE